MYTDPSKVVAELARRRKDKELVAAVIKYLNGLPGGWPEDRVIATLNRYIATARIEDVMFAHAASSLGLKPYWPTYHEEKFMSNNPEKASCVRPRVHRPQLQFSRNWLVDTQDGLDGMPLGRIPVGIGNLQDAHSAARRAVLPTDVVDNTFDISGWNKRQAMRFGANDGNGRLAPGYYHAVMALYICHGVLFEDFHGGPYIGLDRFTHEVVEPAIRTVTRQFGLAPLIVQLPYTVGFLDFPAPCGPIFDGLTEGRRRLKK